jgi:hypothetical protein
MPHTTHNRICARGTEITLASPALRGRARPRTASLQDALLVLRRKLQLPITLKPLARAAAANAASWVAITISV